MFVPYNWILISRNTTNPTCEHELPPLLYTLLFTCFLKMARLIYILYCCHSENSEVFLIFIIISALFFILVVVCTPNFLQQSRNFSTILANFSFPIGLSVLLWLMNLARVHMYYTCENKHKLRVLLSLKHAWIPKSNDTSRYAVVMNTFREYASLEVGFLLNKAFFL